MTTPLPQTNSAPTGTRGRRFFMAVSALAAAALLAAAAPGPVLGTGSAAACVVGSSRCGG
jgi:hypothetical protein